MQFSFKGHVDGSGIYLYRLAKEKKIDLTNQTAHYELFRHFDNRTQEDCDTFPVDKGDYTPPPNCNGQILQSGKWQPTDYVCVLLVDVDY